MSNTNHTQFTQNSKPRQYSTANGQRSLRAGRQDNPTAPRARAASPQPAPPKKEMRPHQMNSNSSRSQTRPTPKRQTRHTTLHLKPRVRAELERVADMEGLSVSATGAAIIEKWLVQNIQTQYATLLETIIDKSIGKHMRSYSNRLAFLLVRVAYASEQTRSLVTNILHRQPGITDELLTHILDSSSKTAKRNITARTPQLATIIAELEQIFQNKGEGEMT